MAFPRRFLRPWSNQSSIGREPTSLHARPPRSAAHQNKRNRYSPDRPLQESARPAAVAVHQSSAARAPRCPRSSPVAFTSLFRTLLKQSIKNPRTVGRLPLNDLQRRAGGLSCDCPRTLQSRKLGVPVHFIAHAPPCSAETHGNDAGDRRLALHDQNRRPRVGLLTLRGLGEQVQEFLSVGAGQRRLHHVRRRAAVHLPQALRHCGRDGNVPRL